MAKIWYGEGVLGEGAQGELPERVDAHSLPASVECDELDACRCRRRRVLSQIMLIRVQGQGFPEGGPSGLIDARALEVFGRLHRFELFLLVFHPDFGNAAEHGVRAIVAEIVDTGIYLIFSDLPDLRGVVHGVHLVKAVSRCRFSTASCIEKKACAHRKSFCNFMERDYTSM